MRATPFPLPRLMSGLAAALALAAAAPAQANTTEVFVCSVSHFVRAGGTELASSAVTIQNVGPAAVNVLRLTIRSVTGDVVHDSGPLAGSPLPVNTDLPNTFGPAGLDLGTVPAGATYYLRTNHIWGNNGVGSTPAQFEGGQAMTLRLEITRPLVKDSVLVASSNRSRDRTITASGAVEGGTRAQTSRDCTRL